MSSVSLTKRLLQRLKFGHIKRINAHFGEAPRKSKDEMIGQITHHAGKKLEALVATDGPFFLAEWNEIINDIGGIPRKSFETVAEEIERRLDPIFEELNSETLIADIRNDTASLQILAGKLKIDPKALEIQIRDTNGNTRLSTFVYSIRAIQNKAATAAIRVASTRTRADSVEKLSQSWMIDHIAGADHIAIAAGFYDAEFVHTLLHKHRTVQSVRLMFNGLGGRRLALQSAELKELEQQLHKKHRKVEIRLAFAPGMFHSKLFLVTQNGATRALVGSANATGAAFSRNEEILVALANSGALTDYFDSAWKEARQLDNLEISAKSLIAFFRTGLLYFKPTASLATTLNPFRELLNLMTNEEKARLGGSALPHADQETGIGPFNLKLAVQGSDTVDNIEVLASDAGQGIKASIKPWSVETCFGYWVPSALDGDWQTKINEAGAQKLQRWVAFRERLKDMQDAELVEKYREYLDAGKKSLEAILMLPEYRKKLQNDPFEPSADLRFLGFLKRVRDHLADDTRLKRLALPFVAGPIPEIWDDILAYEEFRTTFFDYLDQVTRPGNNKPRVPNAILKKVPADESLGGKQLCKQFEGYLKEHGWTDDDWK